MALWCQQHGGGWNTHIHSSAGTKRRKLTFVCSFKSHQQHLSNGVSTTSIDPQIIEVSLNLPFDPTLSDQSCILEVPSGVIKGQKIICKAVYKLSCSKIGGVGKEAESQFRR